MSSVIAAPPLLVCAPYSQPQVESELEVLEFVYDGLEKGAIGVNLGRNVWQNDYPVAMIRALRHIVHENGSAGEAHELFQSIKAGEP